MASELAAEPELYALKRVLIAGSAIDATAFAERAAEAGHNPILMLPPDEAGLAPHLFDVVDPESPDVLSDVEIAVELHAIDLDAKADALTHIEQVVAATVPLMSICNTTSVSEVASLVHQTERLVGVCILPPFSESKLAELSFVGQPNDDILKSVRRLFDSLSVQTAHVQDSPGGVLVRTVCCLVNEAAQAMQDSIATAREIDTAMKLGVNYPDGPLAWGDKIGLDHVLAVMEGLYAEFREERYRPTPALARCARAGRLFHST